MILIIKTNLLNCLIFQRPLFPGKHYIEQINLILNVIGSPDEGDLVSISKYESLRRIDAFFTNDISRRIIFIIER